MKKCEVSLRILTLSALCWLGISNANAGTHTWTGAVSGLWSNTNNWVSNSPPELFETPPVQVIFPASAVRKSVTNNEYNTFFGPVGADSFVILGNNYHFYGLGGGTNFAFTGSPGPFPGGYNVNLYCDATNVIFDAGMDLIFYNTNTISDTASSSLEISAEISGTGGWTFEGLGEMTLDGTNLNTFTGDCWVQAGTVNLSKFSCGFIGCYGGTAISSPLTIGTAFGSAAHVVETDTGGGEIASDVAISQTGFLDLVGASYETIMLC